MLENVVRKEDCGGVVDFWARRRRRRHDLQSNTFTFTVQIHSLVQYRLRSVTIASASIRAESAQEEMFHISLRPTQSHRASGESVCHHRTLSGLVESFAVQDYNTCHLRLTQGHGQKKDDLFGCLNMNSIHLRLTQGHGQKKDDLFGCLNMNSIHKCANSHILTSNISHLISSRINSPTST
ncbi:hypothetical protein QE152_g25759 [Popillia japonica]|uniref:Uncharacterized protein n=1 Tax=Popillia japonica TaxID=7064 RepID=A0AAW1K109_POPJA